MRLTPLPVRICRLLTFFDEVLLSCVVHFLTGWFLFFFFYH